MMRRLAVAGQTLPFRSFMAWLKFTASSALDLCLPRTCAGCRKIQNQSDNGWCGGCLGELPWILSPLCPGCGRPFLDSPDSRDHLCGECSQNAFHFDLARSAVLHAGVVRDRIHQFKFGSRMEWVLSLVDLLECTYSRSGFSVPDFVVPVPLHSKRLKERGFNQAGLLAGEFSRRLGLPVSFNTLRRRNWTAPQTHLDRRQRLKNIKGAFELSEHAVVRDRSILILDDVYTTGATLSECSRTLKKKGASVVQAITVTRASPD